MWSPCSWGVLSALVMVASVEVGGGGGWRGALETRVMSSAEEAATREETLV